MNPLIIGTNGSVSAIDIANGEVLWTTPLDTSGIFSATSGEDVSVLIREGTIYAGCSGHLFALDASSGDMLWHNELEGQGHNDLSLAMEGVAVQFVQKVVRRNSSTD